MLDGSGLFYIVVVDSGLTYGLMFGDCSSRFWPDLWIDVWRSSSI